MKKALFGLVLIAVAVTLSLTAAEVLLRVAGFRYDLYLTHVQFGWPDPVRILRYDPDPELLWVSKNYGKRLARAADASPALVFMGCSCTEVGTYPAALRTRINQSADGSGLRFSNLGVSGWSSYQGLRQLERDVLPLRPKVVTIFFGWNDHWKNFGIADKDVGRFMRRHPFFVGLSRFRLVQFIDWLTVRYLLQRGEEPLNRVSPEDFRANLSEMVRVARDHGIVPVLLTAPSAHVPGEEPRYLAQRWLVDLSTLVPVHRQYADVVREVAKREEVILVDLAEEFDALPRHRVQAEYFHEDGIHLRPAGDQVIAAILQRRFEEEGLLPLLTRDDRP
jgi:lysophospholipase L1-like esterase